MIRKEIPNSDWSNFLEAFTMQHDGWLVDVERVRDGRSSIEVEQLALEGVVPRTGEAQPRTVVVTVGGSTGLHRRIEVRDPERVYVQSEDGVETALEISSGDGSLTRITFVSPVPPETVDGLATQGGT